MAEYHLPEGVITEILSRLPAKSLCKFKCVSKFVLSLTLDYNFVKLHLDRAIQRNDREIIVRYYKTSSRGDDGKEGALEELIARARAIPNSMIYALTRTFIYCINMDVGSHEKAYEIDVSFGDYWNMFTLLGSCNGIVCVANKYQICLLNPCTREFKIMKGQIYNIEYGDDAVYGFGYDNHEDVYKVVQVVESKNSESDISVYSLRDHDTSCSIVSNVPYQINAENSLGVFLNGALHWVGQHKSEYAERIISFDVGSKLVTDFPRPDCDDLPYKRRTSCLTLGMIEGNLTVFRNDYTDVVIWVMQVYGVADSWCRLYSIREDQYWRPSCFDEIRLRPLHFTKNAEVLINNNQTVVMCDLKRKTTRDLNIRSILDADGYKNKKIVIHVPSLLSLKSGTYTGTTMRDEEKENTKAISSSPR